MSLTNIVLDDAIDRFSIKELQQLTQNINTKIHTKTCAWVNTAKKLYRDTVDELHDVDISLPTTRGFIRLSFVIERSGTWMTSRSKSIEINIWSGKVTSHYFGIGKYSYEDDLIESPYTVYQLESAYTKNNDVDPLTLKIIRYIKLFYDMYRETFLVSH